MSLDNNPERGQQGNPQDLSEMIKKAGDLLGLGKRGKLFWFIVIGIGFAIILGRD